MWADGNLVHGVRGLTSAVRARQCGCERSLRVKLRESFRRDFIGHGCLRSSSARRAFALLLGPWAPDMLHLKLGTLALGPKPETVVPKQ